MMTSSPIPISISISKSIATTVAVVAFTILSSMELSQSFTVSLIRSRQHGHGQGHIQIQGQRQRQGQRQGQGQGQGQGHGPRGGGPRNVLPLHIASLSRGAGTGTGTNTNNNLDDLSSIDNELQNALSSPPSSSSSQSQSQSSKPLSSSIMNEIHSILDDGHGHINKELAASIWNWENDHYKEEFDVSNSNVNTDANADANSNVNANPFPFASKLGKYSTRDGLRLVESIATEMMKEEDYGYDSIRYNDLVQEGVVSLMKAMVVWDNGSDNSSDHDSDGNGNGGEDFESFAAREIRSSMKQLLGMSIEDRKRVIAARASSRTSAKTTSTKTTTTSSTSSSGGGESSTSISSSAASVDQIMNPLTKAVLDENPTPDEIALSEMIRHDICDFLERTLDVQELQVIRMKFGLGNEDVSPVVEAVTPVVGLVGTSSTLEDIALTLSMSIGQVEDIERGALAKLRTSFSNDYIGAYLDDDDHTEEVSL